MNTSTSLSISSAVASISLILLNFTTDLYFYSTLGLAFFLFFAVKFFFELGNKIDIRDVMILMASLQWVVGPILAYIFITDDPIFYMAVDEQTYIDFVVPATFMFALGLYLPFWKKILREDLIVENIRTIVNKYPNLDFLFIFGGIFFTLIAGFLPRSLGFFIYLLASIRFIGLYFLILRNRPFKWYIFAFVLISFATISLRQAMFHDLILWLIFMVIIIAFIYRITIPQKIILFILGIVFLLAIQLVKGEFRSLNSSDRSIGEFYDLATENIQDENLLYSDAFIFYNITRINQGWIIARIMYYTPTFEPFANGETIWKGIKASLLPRFLMPEMKTFAGYSEYFERFTGQELARGTSMDLSILGEAYANYGIFGGAMFMFFLGLFYNFILFQIFRLSVNNPSLLFMIPIMFLHVVKAETDFTTTMNFLIKAIMVSYGIFWGLRTFFGMKI